jgi:hypothetical protein
MAEQYKEDGRDVEIFLSFTQLFLNIRPDSSLYERSIHFVPSQNVVKARVLSA